MSVLARRSVNSRFQMHRVPTEIKAPAIAIVVVSLALVSVAGQAQTAGARAKTTARAKAAETGTPPRTPDGQPDLQGVCSFATVTPLERPSELAGKEVLTNEEAAEFEQQP